MTENSEIKNKIAGYLEFVATVQVINEEFDRIAIKALLNEDATTFMRAVIDRKSALASVRERLLIGPETPTEIDAVLREAGYNPDEIGAQMKAAAEQALARMAPSGRKD